MADFSQAIKISLDIAHEGGYVNDPDDIGLETYKGISRKSWPNWAGWQFIDQEKDDLNFPNCLYSLDALNALVYDFYKKEFWEKIQCDLINDQKLAEKFFDTALPVGIRAASIYLQKAAIIVSGHTINVDGIIGSVSVELINHCDPVALLDEFKQLMSHYYDAVVAHHPTAIKYVCGWKRRLMSD